MPRFRAGLNNEPMNEIELLKRKAAIINDKCISVEVDIKKPTWLDKINKRKTRAFSVPRACLATLIYFSELALSLKTEYGESSDKTIAEQLKAISSDAKLAVKMIAILLLDIDHEPDEDITRFLLKNMDTEEYDAVLTILLDHSRVENFMNSIILIKGMSLLKTKEMIAFDNQISGELSEEQ